MFCVPCKCHSHSSSEFCLIQGGEKNIPNESGDLTALGDPSTSRYTQFAKFHNRVSRKSQTSSLSKKQTVAFLSHTPPPHAPQSAGGPPNTDQAASAKNSAPRTLKAEPERGHD